MLKFPFGLRTLRRKKKQKSCVHSSMDSMILIKRSGESFKFRFFSILKTKHRFRLVIVTKSNRLFDNLLIMNFVIRMCRYLCSSSAPLSSDNFRFFFASSSLHSDWKLEEKVKKKNAKFKLESSRFGYLSWFRFIIIVWESEYPHFTHFFSIRLKIYWLFRIFGCWLSMTTQLHRFFFYRFHF